jgi:hypothetical protein
MNKDKKILKQIKREAKSIEPNLYAFINQHFPKKKPNGLIKLIPAATFFAGLLIVTILALESTAGISSSITSEPSSSSIEVELPPLKLNTDQDAIAVSSMTTAALFNQFNFTNPSDDSLQLRNNPAHVFAEVDFQETMIMLKPYLNLFEQFIIQDAPPVVIQAASDRSEYAFLNSFEVADFKGETVQYSLYFNLELIEQIDEEIFYLLTGELTINGGNPILVYGSKSIEEEKITIRFRAEIDQQNYIATRYQFEENETKIVVSRMHRGNLNISMFKLLLEENKTTIELMFLENNDLDRIKDRYRFSYATEAEEIVLSIQYNIAYNNQRLRGRIVVRVIELFDDDGVLIGYGYQALQYNESGEIENEWHDHHRGMQPH